MWLTFIFSTIKPEKCFLFKSVLRQTNILIHVLVWTGILNRKIMIINVACLACYPKAWRDHRWQPWFKVFLLKREKQLIKTYIYVSMHENLTKDMLQSLLWLRFVCVFILILIRLLSELENWTWQINICEYWWVSIVWVSVLVKTKFPVPWNG